MNDQELAANVIDELFWDPKITSTEAIAVSADDGAVTLRGTVGSFRQKREAQKAAERVWGVMSVDNQLNVRLLDEYRREDADLRGDVLQALMLDSLVPTTVDAKVDDGFVTLTGRSTGSTSATRRSSSPATCWASSRSRTTSTSPTGRRARTTSSTRSRRRSPGTPSSTPTTSPSLPRTARSRSAGRSVPGTSTTPRSRRRGLHQA